MSCGSSSSLPYSPLVFRFFCSRIYAPPSWSATPPLTRPCRLTNPPPPPSRKAGILLRSRTFFLLRLLHHYPLPLGRSRNPFPKTTTFFFSAHYPEPPATPLSTPGGPLTSGQRLSSRRSTCCCSPLQEDPAPTSAAAPPPRTTRPSRENANLPRYFYFSQIYFQIQNLPRTNLPSPRPLVTVKTPTP